jgi:hypothetical protein
MRGIVWFHEAGKRQYLSNNQGLGLFFESEDAKEIAAEFGSELIREGGSSEIKPPIDKDKIKMFGQALIERAKSIDKTAEVTFNTTSNDRDTKKSVSW